MATFSDNFNRADGPLGDDWDQTPGGGGIVDNQAYGVSGVIGRAVASMGTGYQRVTMRVYKGTGLPVPVDICCKVNDGFSQYYSASCFYYAGQYYFAIHVEKPGISEAVVTANVGNDFTGWHTISVEYNDGHITAIFDELTPLEWDDSTIAANEYTGFQLLAGDVAGDDFSATSDEPITMEVTPDPVWAGAGSVAMTATLSGAAWTPGVPGSSTLSVDHGTISDQWTADATHIHFTYTPAEYIGTLTFSEDEFSTEDTVTAVAIMPEGWPSGECPFDADFVRTANNTGHLSADEELLTTKTALDPANSGNTGSPFFDFLLAWQKAQLGPGAPSASETGILRDIYARVWGGEEWESISFLDPGTNSLGLKANAANTILNALTANNTQDIQDILDAITAVGPGQWDKLFTQLGIDGQGTFPSLLVALLALWGPGRPTLDETYQAVLATQSIYSSRLADILDQLSRIRTLENLTLGSIMNYLELIRGNNTTTLASLDTDLTDVAIDVANTQTFLNTHLLPTQANTYTIIDLINALAASTAAGLGAIPYRPYWSSSNHYTVQPAVRLESNLTIAHAMDGVLIDLEGADPGTAFFDYDTVRNYRNVGALSFFNDLGYHEQYQPLGWPNGVYMCREMRRAAGVRFHLGRGAHGWVTPFVVTPG